MKLTGLLATFSLILCGQIARGQQNGLFNNQNTETNSFLSKQPSQTMANMIQKYLNQNGKTALPTNANPLQGHVEINSPTSLTNAQNQPPTDVKQTPPLQPLLQQHTLPVQQFAPLQQPLPSQQPLQAQQPLQMQQPLGLQQSSLQAPCFHENTDLIQTPVVQQQANYQPPSQAQIHLKLQPTNPLGVNIVQPLNTQNVMQPQQNLNLRPLEVITPQQKSPNQDIPAVRYHISSQQPTPLSPSNPPVVSNPSIALLPSYNVPAVEQTYIPSYNYIKPVPEIKPTIAERTTTNTVQASPSIITLPSPIVQNIQPTQAYYYGQASDPRQNVYVNQSPGYIYPHQTQASVTAVQAQPTAVISSQPSIISSVPVSVASPQYAIPSSYPVNTIMSPTYSTQKSKSLNLKSLLPLIFNLLREKITSCDCQNGCPCACKKNGNNNPEVLSGYSSQKHYGVLKEDGPPILNAEESEGCLRKRKNCVKNEKNAEDSKTDEKEVSDESQEDEDSDEEVSDDEED